MHNEIRGNSYKYIIDCSYGIDQDGYIDQGTESIVYKGLKARIEGGMQFSCVLKFKPKRVRIDGEEIDRLHAFKTEEWKIFEELRECRSIVRIDDVIEDFGGFSLPCSHIQGGIISDAGYFCVVEEFIDGWNLDEFCRENYWKLQRIESVAHGVKKRIDFHQFSDEEKKRIQDSYCYENILKYQNQILLFMLNLCEIMEFVTEQKDILHLDIKPKNIMVTKHGRELVLIDFGRSRKVTKANRFVQSMMAPVDYHEKESTMEKLYEYGELGYAAPECYCEAVNGSKFPFDMKAKRGRMSIESDIFSFGATFWECLNIFELVTKNTKFAECGHDFYQDYLLNDRAYCNRDLSMTSSVYHKKLEDILVKCTRTRDCDPAQSDKFYHSYKDLWKEIADAKDSMPAIVREEDVKVKNAFRLCGGMLAFFLVFLIISGIYRLSAFNTAQRKWESIVINYNDTQFYRLEQIAEDLMAAAPDGMRNAVYDEIAAFTYKGDDISQYEAEMLVAFLQEMKGSERLPQRVDEIVQNANDRKFKEISAAIIKLGEVEDSIGYDLAQAIYNVEMANSGIVDAYLTLRTYQDRQEFQGAIIKLKNVLDNDMYIKIISDSQGITRQEVQAFFKSIS